jgi:beta-N-acetylhexosaminidase
MHLFAQTQSPKLCYEIHKIMADELNVCGVNLNFSPVCDLLTNANNKVIGDRAFHDDPEEASKFVSAAIRGLQTNGVLACAKHFPGHGNTSKDSHYDLPVVKTEMELLRTREFIPFIKAAKARVELIMVAHLVVDAIDDSKPCTLSEKCYKIIRDELKFTKLIITDDMEMKAITDHFDLEKAAVMALDAGSDLLLYRSMPSAKIALKAVKEALKTKKIAKSKIEEKLHPWNC